MRIFMAAALAASALGTTVAHAQITTYGTRSSFAGAAGATTTETFESCGASSGQSLGNNETISSASSRCSGIAPGITFTPDANGNFYIAPPGQSANDTLALGIDLPGSGYNNIAFASPVSAIGADFNQNFGGGFQRGSAVMFMFDAFAVGGASLGSFTFSVASGVSTFFGITSADLIGSVRVRSAENGYAVLDNVSFSAPTGGVPEPSTWAMLLLGFGIVGAAVRRGRAGVVARTA